ncbi:hypothetical protein B0T21DRAFT_450911 [Apiosordaria backusii]|uniref:Uncharacterized protein n=1 Tax=Apiosordaria backusii TaxID=314023 RepID=A0AA40BL08_9PEZI|nr:hypothetical protein B0T21DRAFT_450911 [Apiosordaria backusii]
MAPQVWFITGSTSGMGLALVQEVAARGDKAIATGRNALARLSHIQSENIALLDLNVTAPLSEVQSTVLQAVSIYGHIDVLVNNAGKSRMSSIEEADEAFVKSIFEVNLFGAIKVTQAVVPHMRAAKAGTITFVGAGLGWQFVFAEGLDKEISPLSLRSLIFEPGGFETGLTEPRQGEPFGGLPAIDDYITLFGKVFGAGDMPKVPGDITKLPVAIVDVIKAEGLAKGRPLPVRVVLGADALDAIRQKCNEHLQLTDAWEDVSLSVVAEGRRNTSPWLLNNCSILKNHD